MTDRTHPDSGSTTGGIVEMLQDRIAELEAQLESIGAGGVSGPLMGQPQAMPDLSQLTERGAKAWAGVDAQGLREGFTAADMATASAHGFRDGVASITAQAADSVQEEAARLDFIERHPEMSLRHRKGRWAFLGFTNYEYEMLPSLRAAIDAAIDAAMTDAARKQGANHD